MQSSVAHDDCNSRPYGDDGGAGGSPHVHDDPDDPDFPDDQLEHPSPEHFHNRLVMNEALPDPNDYQVKLIYVLCLPKGFHGRKKYRVEEARGP